MASNPAPAPAKIKFGTSGWRALIADEFTFANVRRVTEAIAAHVLSRNQRPTLIVGYDPRFFSEEFARTACSVLRARGIGVLLCGEPAPTPAIAYEILRRKTDGAINFTASHNPAEYHGLKFSGPDGGPALPAVTKDIEARCERIAPSGGAPGPHDQLDGVEPLDPRPAYLARLAELIRSLARAMGSKRISSARRHRPRQTPDRLRPPARLRRRLPRPHPH